MTSASWMIARLDRDTRTHHARADVERLALLRPNALRDEYVDYLVKLYGFEAPIEEALANAPDLAAVVRYRRRSELLAADLMTLGKNPVALRSIDPPAIASLAEALGWLYVVERGRLMHGILHRHLAKVLRTEVSTAGCYLASHIGSAGARRHELGVALDRVARSVLTAQVISATAHAAFRRERRWFEGADASSEAA
jgi:heme oxygenase